MKLKPLLLILLSQLAFANDNLFENAEIGVAITKPNGWFFMSSAAVNENLESLTLHKSSLDQLLKEKTELPIATISKYEHPELKDGVTPTINVEIVSLSGAQKVNPVTLLQAVLKQTLAQAPEFHIVSPPKEIQLSGHPGAYSVFTFRVSNLTGESASVKSRIYIAPKGDHFFIIGLAGPVEGPDVSEKEFQNTINTFRFIN